MHHLRFRQIHLDFHTSPAIPAIGEAFDKKGWQDTLKLGHVNSVTTFSKCHHGWTYHPTTVGKVHPHLTFDLLRAQFDAAKEIDINVPIYISAGVDNVASQDHPEWREISHEGKYIGWTGSIISAGFHKMCFRSPYLAYLCEQIKEAVRLFPTADGVFLDIIFQGSCCCTWCIASMHELGLDPTKEEDRQAHGRLSLEKYYIETTAACTVDDPNMPVFHNSGHVSPGSRDILKYFSHLELESLPTGGWGYDHFPMSAKYALKLPFDFLGMTGKFHTTWGEFGGYKHPNALRYECAAMLAFGSKCSVGDQLHPNGALDHSTYAIIGAAYAEVEAKEPWCDHVKNVADIALFSTESLSKGAGHGSQFPADIGAGRVLLEGHFLFDIIDGTMDLAQYKMLILPDVVTLTAEFEAKVRAFLARGGKLVLSGASGIGPNGPLFDIGADWEGESPYEPDFILPVPALQPEYVSSPMVMYKKSQRIRVHAGVESIGEVYDPYFNRTYKHFCSHQHTPYTPTASPYSAGTRKGQILYLAHPVFSIYRSFGQVPLKDFLVRVLRLHLAGDATVASNLPSNARLSLMHQESENRYILHLLYANTIRRGGGPGGRDLDVIEDLQPLLNTEVTLRVPANVKRVTLEPQGKELEVVIDGGQVSLKLNRFACHQMLVLHV